LVPGGTNSPPSALNRTNASTRTPIYIAGFFLLHLAGKRCNGATLCGKASTCEIQQV
jgi:hypothetical protein